MKPDHISGDADDDGAFGQQLRRALRELHDAPEALQRQAIALWPAPAAQPFSALAASAASLAGGVLRHVAAVLSFDSWGAPAVALGMRSQRAATRHLLFSAEGRDIDLRIAPAVQAPGGTAAALYALSGQILGPDDSGELQLERQDELGSHRATLDALGEFRLDDLPSGLYTLTLRLGGDQIVLPPVQVGPQAGGAAA
jgi:hypothetical protein